MVGATYPGATGGSPRRVSGTSRSCLPGVGAQGGDLEASLQAGSIRVGTGLMCSASRSVLYAGSGDDYAEAAGEAADRSATRSTPSVPARAVSLKRYHAGSLRGSVCFDVELRASPTAGAVEFGEEFQGCCRRSCVFTRDRGRVLAILGLLAAVLPPISRCRAVPINDGPRNRRDIAADSACRRS